MKNSFSLIFIINESASCCPLQILSIYIANRPWMNYNIDMLFDVRSGSILFKHSLDEKPDKNNVRFQPHIHEDTYELFYFISGDAEFMVGNNIYDLRSGTLLLIRPGVRHNLIVRSDKPYERITIRFNDHEIPREIRNKLAGTENLYFVRNTQLSNEIMRLDVHYSNMDEKWILYTFRNSLNVILSYVVNYSPSEEKMDLSDEIKGITNYIDDNLVRIDSLSMLCNELHISRSALCKKFSEGYGIPIMTYVRVRKCLYASVLIENGGKPTEVYKQCGFNDYPSFYRAYRKYLHHTPSKIVRS